MHINTVFNVLYQLGIGPTDGYSITSATPVWSDFIGTDSRLNMVKTYVYLRVRMLFDPPSTSYLQDAMKSQIQELEWRMNIYREGTAWVNPITPAA